MPLPRRTPPASRRGTPPSPPPGLSSSPEVAYAELKDQARDVLERVVRLREDLPRLGPGAIVEVTALFDDLTAYQRRAEVLLEGQNLGGALAAVIAARTDLERAQLLVLDLLLLLDPD